MTSILRFNSFCRLKNEICYYLSEKMYRCHYFGIGAFRYLNTKDYKQKIASSSRTMLQNYVMPSTKK